MDEPDGSDHRPERGDGGHGPQRTRAGLDFERVVSFSDSVFAIAMTLLVVTIAIPRAVTKDQLPHALAEQLPTIESFLISFAVIGYFWVGHHRFVSALRYFTPPLLVLNLAFLAAIAFMPFPTDVLGDYGTEPAVIFYAATMAVVSLLNSSLAVCAQRTAAFRVPRSRQALRYLLIQNLIPGAVFALSIPVSLISVTAAQLSWLLIIPAERFVGNRRVASDPGAVDERR